MLYQTSAAGADLDNFQGGGDEYIWYVVNKSANTEIKEHSLPVHKAYKFKLHLIRRGFPETTNNLSYQVTNAIHAAIKYSARTWQSCKMVYTVSYTIKWYILLSYTIEWYILLSYTIKTIMRLWTLHLFIKKNKITEKNHNAWVSNSFIVI